MGWISDTIHNIAEAIRNAANWVSDQITALTKWIDLQKHNFKVWIGSLMETDTGAIAVVAVAIAAAIAGIAIYTQLVKSGVIAKIKTWMQAIADGTGSVLEFLHYRELLVANKILMIVWDSYRESMSKIFNAFASLSQDLGYSFGFVTLALKNAQMMVFTTGALFGIPKEVTAGIWSDDLANFMGSFEANFYKYAEDPGALLDDIDENIVYPHAEEGAGVIPAINKALNDFTDFAEDEFDKLDSLEKEYKQFIADLPEEISNRAMEVFKPFDDQWRDFYDNQYLPVADKVDAVEGAINTAIEREQADVKAVYDKLARPGDLFLGIDLLSDEDKQDQLSIIGDYTTRSQYGESLDYTPSAALEYGGMQAIIDLLKAITQPPEILTLEEPITRQVKEPQKSDRKTWYVGDY